MPRLNPFALGANETDEAVGSRHRRARDRAGVVGAAGLAGGGVRRWADRAVRCQDGAASVQLTGPRLRHGLHCLVRGWATSRLRWTGRQGSPLGSCEAGLQRLEVPAGAAWGERVAWCPTLPILAAAAGKKLRLWNLDGTMLRDYPDHPSTITDIQWKPNDAILASTAYGKLYLWDCLPSPSGRGAGGEGAAAGDSALTPNPSPSGRGEHEPSANSPGKARCWRWRGARTLNTLRREGRTTRSISG